MFSTPQQLWPPGQSQEYRQCAASAGGVHPAFAPATHFPEVVEPRVAQHVLDRRSHVATWAQLETVKLLQSAPVHAPLKHARPPQAAPLFCHIPLALQFCGCWPLHCAWFGAHWPWHDEPGPVPTQVWFVQFTGVAHVPAALQDCCAVVLEHSIWLGAQTPLHAAVLPLTRQVWLVQGWGDP